MSTNARFAVGVHILAYLASQPGVAVTSANVAASVNTNPVVIRRLLSALRKAGLVTAQKGAIGGFTLALPPQSVSLLLIFRALEPANVICLPRSPANKRCPVGAKIQGILESVFEQAQSALEQELQKTTLADIGAQVRSVCTKTH